VTVIDASSEARRLRALDESGLLDSLPEESIDRFTRLAARLIDAPITLVSLVAADRQFFKSQHGLGEPLATTRQTPIRYSFCRHVVSDAAPLVVNDAREHPAVRDNPAVKEFGVIAYLGYPLTTREGITLGSFCAVDTQPRSWQAADLHVLRDLAGAVVAELELRAASAKLNAAHQSLQHLETQRDDLVHFLVHDLRNPLMSVMAGLELLDQHRSLDADARVDLAVAREGADTVVQMIGDILDVRKAESVGLSLDREPVDPACLARDACRRLQPMASAAGVRVALRDGDAPTTIDADARQLGRVLVNLISNAIQHTPRGRQVTVSVGRGESGMTLFTVQDSGDGIGPGVEALLFEKYGKGRLRSSGRLSTGLGLPLARIVVEAHGGRVWAENVDGAGARFSFTIPARTG